MTGEIKKGPSLGHPAIFGFQGDLIIISRRDTHLLNKGNIGTLRKQSGEGLSIRIYSKENLQDVVENNPTLVLKIAKAIIERRVGYISDDKVVHLPASQVKNIAKAGIDRLIFKDTKSSPLQLQQSQGAEGSKIERIEDSHYEGYFAPIMDLIAHEPKANTATSINPSQLIQQRRDTPSDLEETRTLPIYQSIARFKTGKGQSIEKDKEEEITEAVRAEKRKLWEADQEKRKLFEEKERRFIQKEERDQEIRENTTKSDNIASKTAKTNAQL